MPRGRLRRGWNADRKYFDMSPTATPPPAPADRGGSRPSGPAVDWLEMPPGLLDRIYALPFEGEDVTAQERIERMVEFAENSLPDTEQCPAEYSDPKVAGLAWRCQDLIGHQGEHTYTAATRQKQEPHTTPEGGR